MPDNYNITELVPTRNSNEISAILTFSDEALAKGLDASMNAELASGTTVFQTINHHWRLSIRQITSPSGFSLIFSLHSNAKIGRQSNNAGTVTWSVTCRNVHSGFLHKDAFKGVENFTFDPPNIGILCTFKVGPWRACDTIATATSIYTTSLKLTIPIPENFTQHQSLKEIYFNAWKSNSFKIAQLLLDPAGGDVIFVTRDADSSRQKLYAYKSILAGNSEYFASRLKSEWRSKKTAQSSSTNPQNNLEDSGSGRHSEITSSSSLPSDEVSDDRQIIYLDDPADDIDFVTLHNILYFIYIGRVNLPLPKEEPEDEPLPEGFPDEPDVFRLFRIADKFLLPSLKELCSFNLEHDVTPNNVAERLFHPDCEYHEDLHEFYFNYLIANYDEVKETEGWERAVCNDDDVSPSTARYRARLLFNISKKVRQ